MVMFPKSPFPSEFMEKVSSSPQENEQWSKIIFVPCAMPAASLPLVPLAPMRKRTYLTMVLSAPVNVTPLP